MKYVAKKPFSTVGQSFLGLFSNPDNLIFLQTILLIFLLFRKAIINSIAKYPIILDKFVVYTLVVMFLTFVLKAYLSQSFQDDYKKDIEEELRNY